VEANLSKTALGKSALAKTDLVKTAAQTADDERRIKGRRVVNSLAWADPGGVLPVIDCKIIDLSEEGARVATAFGVDMPDIFQLQIDGSRVLGAAEVVWRTQTQVGVKFLRKP
jgi:hypothetical protein